jgi:uncharacterized membrane protein
MAVSQRTRRFVWFAVIFLTIIGVTAVTLRTLVLLWPSQFSRGQGNPAAALDAGFARHRALTLVHILPGALFLVLASLQFMPSIRREHLQFHRWSGRFLVILGLVIGITALIMSYRMNIGGPNETAATTLFAIVFLICLVKAYLFIRRKDVTRHREWMIRAYAVTLGVAATRPIVGMFFGFRRLTPHEFFGIAFWLGFTITFLAGEAWIDYMRYSSTAVAESVSRASLEPSFARPDRRGQLSPHASYPK